jgi:hypothetical protein
MTIQEIRTNQLTLKLDELDQENQTRDQQIQALRGEKREIRALMEPLILKKQRADAIANAGKPSIVLNPGVVGVNLGGR